MLWYEYIIYYLGVLFCHFIVAEVYKLITKRSQKLNSRDVTIIFFFATLSTINTLLNYTLSKIVIHFFIIACMNKFIYKDTLKKAVYYTLTTYLVGLAFELIFGILFLFFPAENIKELDKNLYIKSFFSIVVMTCTYITFKIKMFRKLWIKITSNIYNYNNTISILLCLIMIIVFSLATFSRAISLNSLSFFLFNFIPLIICIIIIILLCKERLKLERANKEQEILMKFLSKYEQIIDKDRVNRHEMLNNLLVLKSFPKKNSEEYIKTIDKFIDDYTTKGIRTTRNLYNLPSGLKGMIFYKINEIEKSKINITSNISTASVTAFDKLDSKLYVKVCKIIGILLDNAIEATTTSQEKQIVLEFYKEKKNIIFYLENSVKGKVDLEKINNQHYSTKGKQRGYGLYIVNKIVSKSKFIELNQQCKNKKFITILEINTNKRTK